MNVSKQYTVNPYFHSTVYDLIVFELTPQQLLTQ
jgi:hypothetical protein